eukprot:1160161-Pelagomonas_calceolata.AAC.2
MFGTSTHTHAHTSLLKESLVFTAYKQFARQMQSKPRCSAKIARDVHLRKLELLKSQNWKLVQLLRRCGSAMSSLRD